MNCAGSKCMYLFILVCVCDMIRVCLWKSILVLLRLGTCALLLCHPSNLLLLVRALHRGIFIGSPSARLFIAVSDLGFSSVKCKVSFSSAPVYLRLEHPVHFNS